MQDEHVIETIERLVDRHGPDSKVVVWGHDTVVDDVRATDMAGARMWSVGNWRSSATATTASSSSASAGYRVK